MMSLTKKRTPQAKKFFRVQSTRLADPFETLNSSLAQSAEELARALVRQPKTAGFSCENRQNHPDAKVLTLKTLS